MTESQPLRILIVGGVAGGASAAARARRCNEQAEIILFEKGPYVSFANCGLPYHIGGEIEERDDLLVATPELFRNRFQIDVRTQHEVTEIDRESSVIRGRNLATGETFEEPYDKLILSTGSQPIVPPFARDRAENLFTLWTIPDMDRILSEIKSSQPKSAVVVGAGFIGLEVVEQLHRLGLDVTLIERAPHVLPPLDTEMALLVENELKSHGVKVITNNGIADVQVDNNRATGVLLDDGSTADADFFILAIGVSPRNELAKNADLKIGATGGVTVDEHQLTSDPNIYAVGDVAEYTHAVTQQSQRVPLAGPANRSGRIAGEHAATGRSEPMAPVLGTAIVRVFDLDIGMTGLSVDLLQSMGRKPRYAIIQAPHHAGYFPGAKNLTLKLIYEASSGVVLGAQVVGQGGVDKRIDVIATAIRFVATVHDLAGVDLAYAPPFGSAKDPIHMAAFAAENDLAGKPELISPDADLQDYQVVDVRSAAELERLPMVAGGHHIPLDDLRSRLSELDPEKPTVAICHSAKRAHVAASILRGNGFEDVYNLTGGMSIRRLYEG
ncbi:FAD-dependent oxidoreductase [Calycomorphotria hydatis]|uniref:Coenzyme A disulfide reductase n=1 Tax=Calycomorphotria hydatis TaxID=2528027 RepID=A0A517T5B1_9PLAN|nr:FAD-dependent oxidoreductase [Calycomorphotria hydatis]QDT63557.1 Coenzyme A disulfide reductase [Calycomorphotria hydatis]